MKQFFRRLWAGGSGRLRGYEAACLGAWSHALPPAGREILARQLERFSMVQRQSDDRLVVFYDLDDPGYAGWPSDAFFPLREEEQRVASVWIRPEARGQKRVRCDVVLHRGRLSSLEFSRSPKTLFPRASGVAVPLWDAGGGLGDAADVDEVTLRLDPLRAEAASSSEPAPRQDQLTGWVQDWAFQWRLEALRPPAGAQEREEALARIDVPLPSGYLELVAQTDGVRVGPVTVYGLDQVRRVVFPRQTVWLLAEVAGRGELGVVEEAVEDGLFFFGDSDVPEPAGTDFREVLERELRRS